MKLIISTFNLFGLWPVACGLWPVACGRLISRSLRLLCTAAVADQRLSVVVCSSTHTTCVLQKQLQRALSYRYYTVMCR